MSRTLRRKNDKNTIGYYDYKDEERNRPGAGNSYYHADMPSRRGRWKTGNKPVKHYSNRNRRAETRENSHAVLHSNDVESVFFPRDEKGSKEDRWAWD